MKRLLLLLTILLLCQSFFAVDQHRKLDSAEQLFELGNYRHALNTIQMVDAHYSDTARYALLRGKIHLAMGDYMSSHLWLSKFELSYLGSDVIASPDLLKKIHEAGLIQEISSVDVSLGRLVGNINSSSSEYAPVLIDDGNTMVFGSTRRSAYGRENIFVSYLENRRWTDPLEIRELCTDLNETVGSISEDGTIMYLSGQYEKRDRTGSIYRSVLRNNVWAKPEIISAVSSPHHDLQPFVHNESVMFFVSNRQGGNRNYDIFVAESVNGVWQNAVSIGDVVNTPYDEQTPFLSPDGEALYFASNGHPGYGGLDIFKSQRIGDSWLEWSEPENLGPIINSVKDDRYFSLSPDNRYAFLSSNRSGGVGFEDIYYVDLHRLRELQRMIAAEEEEEEITGDIAVNGITVDDRNLPVSASVKWTYMLDGQHKELIIETGEDGLFDFYLPFVDRVKYKAEADGHISREEILQIPAETTAFEKKIRLIREGHEVTIYGKVSEVTDQGLVASITWSYLIAGELVEDRIISGYDGNYRIVLPNVHRLHYRVEKPDYMPVSGSIETVVDQKDYFADFTMIRLAEYEVFNIDNIHFEFAKADLLPESLPVLDPIATMMISNPSLRIELSGHTDNVGGRDFNQRLSRSRAQAVADYLVSQNIASERIMVVGHSYDQPIASNETPEGRALNRRVELGITGIEYLEEDELEILLEEVIIPEQTTNMIRTVRPTETRCPETGQAIEAVGIEELRAMRSHIQQNFNQLDQIFLSESAASDIYGSIEATLHFDVEGRVDSVDIEAGEGSLFTESFLAQAVDLMMSWSVPTERQMPAYRFSYRFAEQQ